MIQTAGGIQTNRCIRTWGSFPDLTKDFSILCRFKYPSTPGAGRFVILLGLWEDLADYTKPYLFLGSHTATGDLGVELQNNSTFADSPYQAIINNVQNWAGIVWTASTHTATFYVTGSLVGTVTLDMSGIAFNIMTLLGDDTTGPDAPTAASLGYLKVWQTTKSLIELTAEAASITPVNSTGLLFSNPLQASIDLTDHTGLAVNHFTATGTITTDTVDPLLSVVAGPPTNVDPSTATSINTDSAYFQDTLTAGAATDVWHKVTCTESGVWGACAYGDAVTYKPKITVYEGLANANTDTKLLSITGIINAPIQFPVTAGNDYYFKSTKNGAVTPATLQVSILKALDLVSPIGSILVNDDNPGFPLAVLDATTGYPIHFINDFNVGEGAAILASGKIVVGNELTDTPNTPILYSAQLATLVTLSSLPGYDRIASNYSDMFLMGNVGINPGVLRLVDANGAINATVFSTGATGFWSIGLNVNSSKAYYSAVQTNNTAIKAWNLLTNAADSDLVAGVANYQNNKDIIVLLDGTILIPRSKITATKNFKVIRYNSSGVVQNTYDLGTNGDADNRIARAIDDPTSFWSWERDQVNGGFSIFKNVEISSGTVLSSRTAVQFELGNYQGSATSTPARFGHSESCPFWISPVLLFPSNIAKSGLYKIIPSVTAAGSVKTNETEWIDASAGTSEVVKIPNPFTEGYLVGDEN